MAEEGPGLHREQRGLVRPLLGERPAAVGEVVEEGPVVGAEAGEEDLVVRRDQDVDEVELDEAEQADRIVDVGGGDGRRGAGPVEALGGEGDAARLGGGELVTRQEGLRGACR
jgi:hypothetical protein